MKKFFVLLLASCSTQSAPPETPTASVSVEMLPGSGLVVPEYNRDSWGRWIDEDGDCQDTRQEVLIEESETEVQLSNDGCRVVQGTWTDPFTGEKFQDPSKLDIDHMVPLKAAYDAGASFWEEPRKVMYFNDLTHPGHLRAVSASANRSKGARPPQEWMPPNQKHHCQYLTDWLVIKDRWDLEIDKEEALFLARGLIRNCKWEKE